MELYSLFEQYQGSNLNTSLIHSDKISTKYKWSSEKAGLLLSTIDLMSLFLSPAVGYISDYTGKPGYLGIRFLYILFYVVLLGSSLAVFGYLILGLTYWSPILGTILLACHFCIVSSTLWPCLSLLVASHHIGISFAVASALINATLTGITPLGGYLYDNYGFAGTCSLFAGISVQYFC